MKLMKILPVITIAVMFVACGENPTKKSGDIVGKWQPTGMDVRLKGMAKMFASDINVDEIEKEVLTDARRTGWLELREDGTFVMMDTAADKLGEGAWTYDGQTLSLMVDMATVALKFEVESVSAEELEIDYASFYKHSVGIPEIPEMSMVGDMKLIMTYKRLE